MPNAAEAVRGDAFVLTISEFCDATKISRGMFYKLRGRGEGPRVVKLGTRTLIMQEEARRWLREREGVVK